MSNRLGRQHDGIEVAGHFARACCGDSKSQDWMIRRNIALTKAGATHPDSAGGILAADGFDQAVIAIRDSYAFRGNADVRPASNSAVIRPRRVGGASAAWCDDGAVIPSSAVQWSAITANSKKLACLLTFSSELLEDNAIDLGAFLAEEIGQAMASQEDAAGFFGDGTSAKGGIQGLSSLLDGSALSTSGHSGWSSVDASDIGKVVGAIDGNSLLDGAGWFCHPACIGAVFSRLSSQTGGFVMDADAGPRATSYLGFPIYPSAAFSSSPGVGDVLFMFGCLRRSACLYERRPLTIAFSRDRQLDSDIVLCRCVERIGVVCHDVGASPTAMISFIGAS